MGRPRGQSVPAWHPDNFFHNKCNTLCFELGTHQYAKMIQLRVSNYRHFHKQEMHNPKVSRYPKLPRRSWRNRNRRHPSLPQVAFATLRSCNPHQQRHIKNKSCEQLGVFVVRSCFSSTCDASKCMPISWATLKFKIVQFKFSLHTEYN